MELANQNDIKMHSQKVILSTTMKHYPISRAKLSELTNLNKATVSLQTNSLIEKHLVSEIGVGVSNGGRKPVLLVFNKNAGYSIGVELAANYILTILIDLEGNKLFSDYFEFVFESVEALKSIFIDRIRLVTNHAPESPYGIIGIGVGVHGFVNENQTVVYTPHSNWDKVDIKNLLESHFNFPVFIDNEANAGAFGEKLYGAIKNSDNSIYISVGTGIGLAIIINDKLYRGSDGVSGEMGHMTIEFNGKKCGCGNQGCWELYASENAFFTNLSRIKNGREMTLEKANKMIMENDGDILIEIEKFGYYLGIGLANLINTFNPESIILRSNLIEANPIVLKSIKKALSNRISSYIPLKNEIFISQLNNNAAVLGAASFMIKKFLVDSKIFN
ncbi:XylR family transcriptional regulator [Bacillus sp. AFS076308]|uniref:ROK family protein n=1 Tax=unclassified Bacillus (in: firmicutes) TaxID=185979 RepID=UPI000BF7B05C|nr:MULTISPECIES: ROK family protein [unclassified Bacillus (in: firmicutes)]PFN83269.1 XylR family transcriptional regulator [Bacillus sp. AFS076308]PGV49473.1 XylR family transcriptional regulator [Bacillus sp. AFS037270]